MDFNLNSIEIILEENDEIESYLKLTNSTFKR